MRIKQGHGVIFMYLLLTTMWLRYETFFTHLYWGCGPICLHSFGWAQQSGNGILETSSITHWYWGFWRRLSQLQKQERTHDSNELMKNIEYFSPVLLSFPWAVKRDGAHSASAARQLPGAASWSEAPGCVTTCWWWLSLDLGWWQGLSWPRQGWWMSLLPYAETLVCHRGLFFLEMIHGITLKVIVSDQPWVLTSLMTAPVVILLEDWGLAECLGCSWMWWVESVEIWVQVDIGGAPASWWGWYGDDENHWHWAETKSHHDKSEGDVNHLEGDPELIRMRCPGSPDFIIRHLTSDSRTERRAIIASNMREWVWRIKL